MAEHSNAEQSGTILSVKQVRDHNHYASFAALHQPALQKSNTNLLFENSDNTPFFKDRNSPLKRVNSKLDKMGGMDALPRATSNSKGSP